MFPSCVQNGAAKESSLVTREIISSCLFLPLRNAPTEPSIFAVISAANFQSLRAAATPRKLCTPSCCFSPPRGFRVSRRFSQARMHLAPSEFPSVPRALRVVSHHAPFLRRKRRRAAAQICTDNRDYLRGFTRNLAPEIRRLRGDVRLSDFLFGVKMNVYFETRGEVHVIQIIVHRQL